MNTAQDRATAPTTPNPIRRANGTGSISLSADQRVATVRVTLPNGRRRKRIVNRRGGERFTAFERRVEDSRLWLLSEIEAGATVADRITVTELADRWLGQHDGAPATVAHHRRIVGYYIVPAIGRKSVRSIEAADVERIDARLYTDGKATGTRKHVRTTLRGLLDYAVRRGIITANPTALADRLRRASDDDRDAQARRRRNKAIELDAVARFLDLAADHRLGPLVAFMTYTGVRRSEALGLGWDALDLDAGTVTIRTTLTAITEPGIGTTMCLGGTKTIKGHRTINLPSRLVPTLRQWRTRQAAERLAAGPVWSGSVVGIVRGEAVSVDLVFTDEAGRPVSIHVLRRVLANLGCHAEIDGAVHPHRLRHAAATLLLAAESRGDLTLADVAATLGHADATVTLSVYGHETSEGMRSAANALDVMGSTR